jgi:hypothetical protein
MTAVAQVAPRRLGDFFNNPPPSTLAIIQLPCHSLENPIGRSPMQPLKTRNAQKNSPIFTV